MSDHLSAHPAKQGSGARVSVCRRAGFTLIELLIATTILALLVLLIAQIVQSGNLLISGSRKHLSAAAQAREVFSRFDLDLNRMPVRPDLRAVFSANNDTLFFYSEAPGAYASADPSEHNSLSLVGYRVNGEAELERLGKGLSWTDPLFLTYATNQPATNSPALASSTIDGTWASIIGSPPAYDDGTDADYHLLADGVFRIFLCFQKTDGTYAIALDPNAVDGQFYDAAAIILTLAVLDSDSRKIVDDATKLAGALPDPTAADLAAGTLPAALWQSAVDNVSQFAVAASVPESVVGRIRIYQRSFRVH